MESNDACHETWISELFLASWPRAIRACAAKLPEQTRALVENVLDNQAHKPAIACQ